MSSCRKAFGLIILASLVVGSLLNKGGATELLEGAAFLCALPAFILLLSELVTGFTKRPVKTGPVLWLAWGLVAGFFLLLEVLGKMSS